MPNTYRVDADALEAFTRALFLTVGTPEDIAGVVARILVDSDRKGHASHGVLHLANYVEAIENGHVTADGRPEVLHDMPSALLVHGHNGPGHYTARECMAQAIERARDTGVCAVSVPNCGHIGRLGEYTEQAVASGMIGFAATGTGGPGRGGTAPYGGAASRLSTNPISFAAPTDDDSPFMADFATTGLANSKVQVYQMQGKKLPPGVGVDKDGNPTDDPNDLVDGGGGHLLVFGGYKGYAINMWTCLLGGLTGEGEAADHAMSGTFLMAVDPDAFGPGADYRVGVRSFLDAMRSTPPAPGFAEVLVPGDLESGALRAHATSGVQLAAPVWTRLNECGRRLSVEPPATA